MNFQEMSEAKILEVAIPIMDNLMDASTAIDHERHIRDYTVRLKEFTTLEHLKSVCTNYQAEKGFFRNREVVAVFRRPDSAAIIWKQYFTKAEGEFVAEMVLVHQHGRYLCDHVMVF
ncbi:hypothetical protein [Oceanicoccus sp. KOV_DT_Chl]|uniref:hypothetical protein n=1 Tax=Oceanicoccus sp. KOV_DT_Chl TaxID=1904639 RepID=UPI000C7C4595|nr:hypothetical protein [Oceanicoccus sp. KOV_DT_Chl]